MRATAEIPMNPWSSGAIDVDAAGTLIQPGSFVDAWNGFLRDDGTLARRAGLGSHHEALDGTGSALAGLGLTRWPILGLFQFDRVTDARQTSTMYLAKAGDYLVGSRYGTRFDLKLARHLGVDAVADFTEAYSLSEHRRYVVLCTNDRGWSPAYWNGQLTPSASAYDIQPWEYFRPLNVGYHQFSVFHDGRLFLGGGDPFQVIYSSEADFRDFKNGGSLVMTPDFGKVTGFFRTFFGQLIIGQERALTRVVQVSPGVYDGEVIVHKIGLANNRSSDMMGNDQIFLSTDGRVYTLSTVQEFGDVKAAALSAPLQESVREASLHGQPYSWVKNDRENQIVWFGLATGNRVDRCVGYSYKLGQWVPRLANKSIVGPSCAASWRMPRWNGREKLVVGSYETNNFAATQRGRIWTFTHRHKEDHFLSSRSEADDATATSHLKPKVRFPNALEGGGAAGWPHQSQVTSAGTYVGSSTTYSTIQIRIESISSGSGVIGTGTISASWRDVKGSHSGTISLGSAYTPGNAIALTGTGITVTFAAPQSVATRVGEEVWLFIDRGRRQTEVYAAALYDDIDLKKGLRKVAASGRPYKNFVPRASTPILCAGSPTRKVHLAGVTVITRVTGERADDQIADEANANYELSQSPFRNYLDLLLKCDEDPEWTQIGLLSGNAAKQYHLNESKMESVMVADPEMSAVRPARQFVLGASQLDADPLVDPLMVNKEFIRIDRPCTTWRFMVGQFTPAANHWGGAASHKSFIGDFVVVGLVMHVTPVDDEDPARMGYGSLSKTWEVGG